MTLRPLYTSGMRAQALTRRIQLLCAVVWCGVWCWDVVWYGVVCCGVLWCAVEAAIDNFWCVWTQVDEIVERC